MNKQGKEKGIKTYRIVRNIIVFPFYLLSQLLFLVLVIGIIPTAFLFSENWYELKNNIYNMLFGYLLETFYPNNEQ